MKIKIKNKIEEELSPPFVNLTNNCCCAEGRKEKDYCLERYYKLFIDENRLEVVEFDHSIASIFSFRIGILLFSEYVWFNV